MGVNALPTIWESWMSPTATFPPLIVCLAFTAAADLIEFRVSDCFSYNNPNDEPVNTSWLCQLTLVGCSMLATIFSLLLLISAVLWQSGREDYQTNVWQHLVRFTMVNGTQVLAASHALHTERPVRSLAGSPSDLWEKHYLPSALMTGGILSRDGSTLSTLSNGEWNLFILTPRFYSASVQFRYYPAHCARATFCLSSYSYVFVLLALKPSRLNLSVHPNGPQWEPWRRESWRHEPCHLNESWVVLLFYHYYYYYFL